MRIKVSSGQEMNLDEILDMPSGSTKKFWLLATVAQISDEDAAIAARELSCREIIREFNLHNHKVTFEK